VSQTVEVTGEIPQLKTDRATWMSSSVRNMSKTFRAEPQLHQFRIALSWNAEVARFQSRRDRKSSGGGQIRSMDSTLRTNFELDGTDNQDPILGIIVVNPNLDAIGEAKIALQDYDAESGKATSGIVKVQTKSGSNEFHGSGFYYYRNSDQQARDPFTNKPGVPLAPANWKQFGGSVGGPIIKNKLFFFGDYQGTKQIQGITNQYTVPTAEAISTCNPATNAASDTPGFCNLSQYTALTGGGLISTRLREIPLTVRVVRNSAVLWVAQLSRIIFPSAG